MHLLSDHSLLLETPSFLNFSDASVSHPFWKHGVPQGANLRLLLSLLSPEIILSNPCLYRQLQVLTDSLDLSPESHSPSSDYGYLYLNVPKHL